MSIARDCMVVIWWVSLFYVVQSYYHYNYCPVMSGLAWYHLHQIATHTHFSTIHTESEGISNKWWFSVLMYMIDLTGPGCNSNSAHNTAQGWHCFSYSLQYTHSFLTVHQTKQTTNMKTIPAFTFVRNVEGICFQLGNIHYTNYVLFYHYLSLTVQRSRKHKTIIYLFILNFVKVKTYFCWQD